MDVSRELFHSVLDNLHDGVYFVDCERVIKFWSKGAERITGYASEDVVNRKCFDNILRHVDDEGHMLCMSACPLAATILDGQARNCRLYLHHKDGHRLPVRIFVAPIRDETGRIIGGVESFHDDSTMMAALKEIEDLREESLLCPLTGVSNRRHAEKVLHARFDEMRRNGTRLAILFIDIDHFKDINDEYGHEAGDSMLRMVARTLTNAMRSYDFLARWGGEEFIAVLPAEGQFDLEGAANRLRVLVERSHRTINGGSVGVSVSVGGVLIDGALSVDEAIHRADRLMYESKQRGRNCVTVCSVARERETD